MISVKNVTKSFGIHMVLDDISLDFKEGEVVVILGESGTGKSVLLKHLIGLLRPDKGKVIVDGHVISELPEKKLLNVRQHIGYLFQEGALYDFMTVFDNIAFPLREHANMSKKEIKDKIYNILELVDLEKVDKKYPSELSGGMKKRVALARAIILDSKILLCDEPTSGLDPIRSRDISVLIRDVSKKLNCTTLITSHDIRNSFRIADRIVLLKDGKVVADGCEKDLMHSSNPFVKEFVTC